MKNVNETLIVDGKPILLNYFHDREIPDRVWNTYMKRYGDKYRLIRDEIGIWHIRCKFGSIQLYSLLNHQLSYVGDYRSKGHKTFFKKKLDFSYEITQEGDCDIVIMFDERLLHLTEKCLKIYKRYKLTQQRREELRKQINEIRMKRNENMVIVS